MTTVLNGLIGGLVAGLVAASVARLVRRAVDSSDAPALAAAVLGARTAASGWWGLAAEVLYGCVAGGTFVALELSVLGVLGVPPATGAALASAVGWSVALFAVAAVVCVARGRSLDGPFAAELVVYHLAYGLCLGVWIRVTWIT